MRRQRRGNAATNGALIVGMVTFSALIIDLGWAWVHTARLQHVNDAMATAAASRLDGSAMGLVNARVSALRTMRANSYFGSTEYATISTDPTAEDAMIYGNYDKASGAFTATLDHEQVNAVRINLRDDDITPFLGNAIFDVDSLATATRSTAVWGITGASEVGCYLPIGVPSCFFTDIERETFANRSLRLQPAGNDNVGWASVGASPSASQLSDQLVDTCGSGKAGIGDMLNLDNGAKQSVLQTMDDMLESSGTSWASEMGSQPSQAPDSTLSNYGRTLEAPALVFDGGSEYCTGGGGSWTGSAPVVGIAWGVIYDIDEQGSASDRNFYVRFDFARMHRDGTAGGGPMWGVNADGITQLVE